MRNSAIVMVSLAGLVAVTAAAIRHPAASRGSGGIPAPELTNTSWLNADRPLRLAGLRGRVVLLHFLGFTLGNCTPTLPALVSYHRVYRGRGATIIGIHTPGVPPHARGHAKGQLPRAL